MKRLARYLLIPVGAVVAFYAVTFYAFYRHITNLDHDWLRADWEGWAQFKPVSTIASS